MYIAKFKITNIFAQNALCEYYYNFQLFLLTGVVVLSYRIRSFGDLASNTEEECDSSEICIGLQNTYRILFFKFNLIEDSIFDKCFVGLNLRSNLTYF